MSIVDDVTSGFGGFWDDAPASAQKDRTLPAVSSGFILQTEKFARELARRRQEATLLYEPMPHQLDFHNSLARFRLAEGSNRSGKTTCGAIELAKMVLNRHPSHNHRMNGKAWVVSASEDHLADTLCPKLFNENEKFRMIRDPVTKQWRAFRPYAEWDKAYYEKSKPFPPLIHHRYFSQRPSYITKNRGSYKQVKLKSGWEITFFLGGSTPPAGADVDYVWFDEEIGLLMWYTEMAARLLDRRGFLTWTATPQVGGEALTNMRIACEEHLRFAPSERLFERFHLLLADNHFVGEQEKRELEEAYKNDPDTYRVRILGESLTQQHLVYPTFAKSHHITDGFPVPDHWCRYAVVDPGHSVLAVEFFAVPPQKPKDEFDAAHQGHIYLFDELYIRQCDSDKFAKALKEKTDGQAFQDFIIDYRGSRRTEMGGDTIRQQLAAALEFYRVAALGSGSDFLLGSDNVEAGLSAVRKWMNQRAPDGRPVLQIFKEAAPNLVNELQRYHTTKVNGVWTDKPHQANNHACDCLRYGAMHGLAYVEPKRKVSNWSLLRVLEKRKRSREGQDHSKWMAATGGR